MTRSTVNQSSAAARARGWHAQGKITDFAHGDSFDLVVGDATKAYGGRLSRAIREVVHVRPGIFVIHDDLASSQPRTFEFQLHAIDEMKVDPATNTVLTTRPKASLTTRFVHPAGLEFSQTDKYTLPPTWPPDRKWIDTWHLTAAQTEKLSETEFLTVLLPARADEAVDLPATTSLESATARGVEIRYADDSRCVVGFARPEAEGELTLAEFVTDAHIFAIYYAADGTLSGRLFSGGSSIKANGEELAGSQGIRTG